MPSGRYTLERGADHAKDQSYVVYMLDQSSLARTLFPVGAIDKAQVRRLAAERGLRTASKPDSQDVCFITSTGGRQTFLGDRIAFRRGSVVDSSGATVGEVDALEMVTVGQRRGIGLPGGGPKRYVVDVDLAERRVVVGDESALMREEVAVGDVGWTDQPGFGQVRVQTSAHGATASGSLVPGDDPTEVTLRWDRPQRRVAPGQSVVFYDTGDRRVLGGGIAAG
jgi:tRNA-specific 2-thiouridylase